MEQVADKVQLDHDFTELYRAHLRDVYSYAYYRIGNHHDAEAVSYTHLTLPTTPYV